MDKLDRFSFYLINFIFMTIPVSFILGNFAINLNMLILFLISFIYFFIKKEKIKIEFNSIDKLIIIFFFYTLLVLLINFSEKKFDELELNNLIVSKTFLYQRYIILYFLLRILLEKKILNIKWFNTFCAICACFVCLDVFFQFFVGKDFFGITSPSSRHYSAVFGTELIAGSYIQRFGFFLFFYFFSLKKNIIIRQEYIIILLFIFILLALILSGNRIPLILFLFGLGIYGFLDSNFKIYITKIFFITITLITFLFFININIKTHIASFYVNGIDLIKITFFKKISEQDAAIFKKPYVGEFYCSKIFIKKNPVIGGGIRSYRTNSDTCITHPHNYYLELIVDLGIVGFGLILLIFFKILKKIILYLKFKNSLPLAVCPFILILLTEFFPFRTSGSIFSTNNATIIYISLAVFVSLINIKKELQ